MWFKPIFKFHTISQIFYRSQIIQQRIDAFRQIDFCKQAIAPGSIQNPSFLREAKAKDILEYVKIHKIPNNIRILHALTHIEYNAFMSYVDTLLRFRHQTESLNGEFVHDFKTIALEEGSHFTLLQQRLIELGYDYGCMPVIPKLTNAIKSTEQNLIERIGVISLMHQGRGVKAVEKLLNQLAQVQDHKSVEVVKIIQKDEIGHFEMGWKWFRKICELKRLDITQQIEKINERHKCNIIVPAKLQRYDNNDI